MIIIDCVDVQPAPFSSVPSKVLNRIRLRGRHDPVHLRLCERPAYDCRNSGDLVLEGPRFFWWVQSPNDITLRSWSDGGLGVLEVVSQSR